MSWWIRPPRGIQTAHLLADLGVGPQDLIALLLPNLFEMPLLLWSGQAAGIICPINLDFPPNQVVALLKSPFMTKNFALHLMRLGLRVYVICESTTQAIAGKDALVAV